ncbi:hypothetical protein FSP39_019715 [Pinctada imbricata]|uniref:Uncharacterized protein n=1 Tax=Pinctada imbricata TaxID=66713 RepID=A0AA88YRY5_PINIB|nr:hypothetical protein FSP39_019715 [Pinctada imbricata]
MGIFTKKQSKELVSLPASEQTLKENLRSILDVGASDIELITDKEEIIESDGKEFDYALCRFVHFDIFIRSSTPRLHIEETLINFKNQLVDGCILSESPQVLITPRPSTDGAPGNEKILRGKSLVNAIDFFIAKVSKVLTCTQIELYEDEYNISNDNLSIFLHGIDRNVPFDEFAKSTTGHIRICLEYLKEKQYFLRPHAQSNEVHKYSKYLWTMSLVCSIISIISLGLTLTIYFLLPQLRTTSGKLLILMMVSLLLTMLFMQLSYFTIQMPDGCVISAAMLHFFWLSVFTRLFVEMIVSAVDILMCYVDLRLFVVMVVTAVDILMCNVDLGLFVEIVVLAVDALMCYVDLGLFVEIVVLAVDALMCYVDLGLFVEMVVSAVDILMCDIDLVLFVVMTVSVGVNLMWIFSCVILI